jgi:hypothetical protein
MSQNLHRSLVRPFMSLATLLPLACAGASDQDDVGSAAATLEAGQCAPAYSVRAYSGGELVSNRGANYECKAYPFSGWCGIAGAYEPGVGSAWQDAWIAKGACGGAATGGGTTGGGTTGGGTTGGGTSGAMCAAWVAGTSYAPGSIVSYQGSAYIATHDNPGYDPTISTWFWSPYTGSGCSTGGGSSGGGSTGGTACPAWQPNTNYVTGVVVTYNGGRYIATHDNPGYDPTISTWFWSPYTGSGCGSASGGSSGGGSTGGGSTGTGKLAVKAGSVPAEYLPWLQKAADMCPFLDAPHLAAQIDQESRWDPNAVSWLGAQGLTQFLPGTWAGFGGDADGDGVNSPFDPPDAIIAQGRYMCYLVGQFGSGLTWTTLLWAYNAGPEATKNAGGVAPTQEASDYAYLIQNQLLPKYKP